MKIFALVLALGLFAGFEAESHNGDQALFVRTSAANSRKARAAPALSPADVMAKNILEWIQGIYRQGTRRTRQQSEANAYLPPYSTQRPPERPRPFQPAQNFQQQQTAGVKEVTSYPNYQQPSSVYTPPSLGFGTGYSVSPAFAAQTSYQTPKPSYLTPSSQTPSSASSSSSSYSSSSSSSSGFGVSQNNYGASSLSQPRPIPSNPPQGFQSSSAAPYSPSVSYIPPSSYQPSTPQTSGISVGTGSISGGVSSGGYYSPSSSPTPSFPTPSGPTIVGSGSSDTEVETNSVVETGVSVTDEDLKHPPHIHAIDVECSKTMMTINIEFNRAFDGVIYSKGFYTDQNCRYVTQGSGNTKYSFTVSLDSCGTQFINDFEGEAGQAYLENVLVLQNEPGIQEVWDTVRRVRCLWEGNINKALSVSLSVDMLNQEIVTFSGDTASAKLDIQTGKGPFAPAANGLVKIGETMTLVVSVEGDPGFDLQVHDCVARDETSTNVVKLTDERGCILKPKLFGAFQKTRETGNTGASIIAYAFFQAFKFPDVMDLFLECNIELCKTDCDACPEPNQQVDPGRRRRDLSYSASNSSGSLSEPVRVGKGFRVIMPEDLSGEASNLALEKIEEIDMIEEEYSNLVGTVCMSNAGFYLTFTTILSFAVASTISSAIFYVKLQKIRNGKSNDLPKGY